MHDLMHGTQVAGRGCNVHGIVRYRTHWGNLAGMLDGSVVFHKGDITDAAFVRFAMDRPCLQSGFPRRVMDYSNSKFLM